MPLKDKSSYGDDTFGDGAHSAILGAQREAARAQGGTQLSRADVGSEKGNDDAIDMERSERVHCDPQGFQWYDHPRSDNEGHGGYDCCY